VVDGRKLLGRKLRRRRRGRLRRLLRREKRLLRDRNEACSCRIVILIQACLKRWKQSKRI